MRHGHEDEALSPARGIINGVCISFLVWGVICVSWCFLSVSASVGPNCPGNVDPSWLGDCDAPEAQLQ